MDLELDIEVGDDHVLGEVDRGFPLAMWALQGGRIAIAAQALGIGQAALDEAIAYARERQQFGQPIARYQAIQWMIADMATELDAARLLTWKAAAARDLQEDCTFEASMAKLAASEAGHKAADKACRFSRQPAIGADPSSSGCSATCARRKSTRARPRRSG
jgi:alkylation response protein AidB-like acyl-CoA dehydrogenase